jgi:CTP:molybdopterin cytidylyltransferase MocA
VGSVRDLSVCAAVLAAGGSRRFEGTTTKLLADFRGRPLVEWALEAALDADVGEVIVVTGAVHLEVAQGITVVDNPAWAGGLATSLQAAVSHARARGHERVVVGLGDQPLVPATAWRAVAESEAPVAVATFAGRRRPPVGLGASVWDLLPIDGDEGARAVMRERPDLVTEVACDGEPADIDTAEDLARWS